MDLWTEFEGVTIDSAYSLTRLLQTEGRSAFFSTVNAKGDPVLIRIIECHFDEDEILARWRGVESLGHPAFLRIDRFGQFLIEEDEITAVYAVFERVDENLAHVLERGRLSAADAAEIGRSVASALETLHANGFVHQHVEARNIYAVGECVKLRSDCIRETPEGFAGAEARRRDAHDLALLLMQVLKGTAAVSAPGRDALPPPFDEIARNGMDGTWGVAEIHAALKERAGGNGKLTTNGHDPAAKKLKPAGAVADAHADGGRRETQEAGANQPHESRLERESTGLPRSATASPPALPGMRRKSMDLPVVFGISQETMRRWMQAGGLLVGVLILGWLLLHWMGHRASGAAVQGRPETTAATQVARPARDSSPGAGAKAAQASPHSAAQGAANWRVVAFTYSRKDQAEKKTLSLAHKYPSLSPAVFSPNGKAPWLVTIGGVQTRDAAFALARRAPGMGLPRDTYAQNYKAR